MAGNVRKRTSQRDARYAISLTGVLLYVSYCSVVLGVCCALWRHLTTAFQGTYSVESAAIAETMIAITTGLIFVAIGIAVSFALGYIRYYVRVAAGAFMFGAFFFWPMFIFTLICLAALGLIDLD